MPLIKGTHSGHLLPKHQQRPRASYQTPAQRTYSGDILDKHPEVFHKAGSQQHFTPRTHRKQKESFLSYYRYYASPQVKRKGQQERTKIFSSPLRGCRGNEHPAESESRHRSTGTGSTWADRNEKSEEEGRKEETQYLQFLEDVTYDLLRYGFYSDSVLECVLYWQMSKRADLSQNKLLKLSEDLRTYLNS
ncbi:spermatogenesis-associated protein 7-like [Polymixia lowei]